MSGGGRERMRGVRRRRSRATTLGRWFAGLTGAIVLVQSWRFVSGETVWEFVADAPAQATDLFGRALPPEWGWTGALIRPLWDTLTIATFGTALAIAVAIPLALAAARNTTPHPAARPLALLVIVSSRSINSLLWALLLVAVLGPGMTAGILAVALRSIGFVAKLLYESIEEVDPAPLEAVAATGAAGGQIVSYAIAPQVAPAFAGIALFRWDINLREATIVGLVGAGGIGLPLDAAVSALQWPRVSLILMSVFALVLAGEWMSARLRAVLV